MQVVNDHTKGRVLTRTLIVCDSLSVHRWKRDQVFVARGMEELDVLGLFELAILVERTLIEVI